MCAPDAYDLKYEINDWMSMQNRPDVTLAAKQWADLYRVLTEEVGAHVELVHQEENAPDMVFTANAGLVRDQTVYLSNFRHPERQVEVLPYKAWFEAHGYETIAPPTDYKFEGEGDALFAGEWLVAGYRKRSDITSHHWLAEQLQVPVLSLELVDGRWYHLDTAFFALTPELVVYYPGAFDDYAGRALKDKFETIEVEHEEALRFACNSVVIGKQIVMPAECPQLQARLEALGYTIHSVELSEFLKSGGAAKCLTLFI
jgi:N-dimethylarginine dimethylaminohydrolase